LYEFEMLSIFLTILTSFEMDVVVPNNQSCRHRKLWWA